MDTGLAILLIGCMAIALGLSICQFVFHRAALAAVSGLFWLIVGMWALLDTGIVGGGAIGICSLAMCILMFLSQIFLKDKAPEIIQRSYSETMAEQIEQMRNYGTSFKPRKKDVIL
jgi:hypothetical protein